MIGTAREGELPPEGINFVMHWLLPILHKIYECILLRFTILDYYYFCIQMYDIEQRHVNGLLSPPLMSSVVGQILTSLYELIQHSVKWARLKRMRLLRHIHIYNKTWIHPTYMDSNIRWCVLYYSRHVIVCAQPIRSARWFTIAHILSLYLISNVYEYM